MSHARQPSPENSDEYADYLYAQDLIAMSAAEQPLHRTALAPSATCTRLWPAIKRLCSVLLPWRAR